MSRRLPDLPDRPPAWLTAAVLGIVATGTIAVSVVTDDASRLAAASDDEYGWDCRVQGNRVCGSAVTGQQPGTYAAPDGGTYAVVLVPPYDACLAAAGVSGPSGFDKGVCEPLAPEQEGEYVYTGPMSWEYQGAIVSVPGLAEDIADGCADQPGALLDCVGAVIGQRMEHRP